MIVFGVIKEGRPCWKYIERNSTEEIVLNEEICWKPKANSLEVIVSSKFIEEQSSNDIQKSMRKSWICRIYVRVFLLKMNFTDDFFWCRIYEIYRTVWRVSMPFFGESTFVIWWKCQIYKARFCLALALYYIEQMLPFD